MPGVRKRQGNGSSSGEGELPIHSRRCLFPRGIPDPGVLGDVNPGNCLRTLQMSMRARECSKDKRGEARIGSFSDLVRKDVHEPPSWEERKEENRPEEPEADPLLLQVRPVPEWNGVQKRPEKTVRLTGRKISPTCRPGGKGPLKDPGREEVLRETSLRRLPAGVLRVGNLPDPGVVHFQDFGDLAGRKDPLPEELQNILPTRLLEPSWRPSWRPS